MVEKQISESWSRENCLRYLKGIRNLLLKEKTRLDSLGREDGMNAIKLLGYKVDNVTRLILRPIELDGILLRLGVINGELQLFDSNDDALYFPFLKTEEMERQDDAILDYILTIVEEGGNQEKDMKTIMDLYNEVFQGIDENYVQKTDSTVSKLLV